MGTTSIDLLRNTEADIVIADPDMQGFAWELIMPELRQKVPPTKLFLLGLGYNSYTCYRAMEARVDGYVDLLGASADELFTALSKILNGTRYFSAAVIQERMIAERDPLHFSKLLSPRELVVLSQIGVAKNDSEIAEALSITVATAKTYRSQLIRKLRLQSTPKLVYYALAHGIAKCRTEI